MPKLYPKGSYIVRAGERCQVLEELGELRFLSVPRTDGGNAFWFPSVQDAPVHVSRLNVDGWKVEEGAKPLEPWEPEKGDLFFFVSDSGDVDFCNFDGCSGYDIDYYEAGNCYRTREEAERAAERVRKAYRG